jgi:DNA-binding NarL/FixJ family response regulator
MDSTNLFVLDDLSLIRCGIRHQLKDEENIKVVGEASTYKEAIHFLNENEGLVDILIMDARFSQCCGLETMKKLLKNNLHLKILVFTDEQNKIDITAMLKAGALGYVLKEDSAELIDAINSIARGNNYYSYNISVKMVNLFLNKEKATVNKLSTRESEVLTRIATGETNKIVGANLNISYRTVETHRRNILGKLSVKNTAEMINYAFTHKLIA